MSRPLVFALYFLAIFLQAGAYGLTFMLPRLFAGFGADEKTVGAMLLLTAIATIVAVYYSGHLSDLFGRVRILALACVTIAAALALYGLATSAGSLVALASILLGGGWGLTYALGPIVMARLVKAEERVQIFALLSVFVMAGFGLAPVLASLLERWGATISDAFLLTAMLCVISAILFFALIRPIADHALNDGPEPTSRLNLRNIATILRSPAVLPVTMVCLGASVFAGMSNFQTVYADARGLNYAQFFLIYTVTVVAFRLVLVGFSGGANPYFTIAALQYVMAGSVILFLLSGANLLLYWAVAVLFGIGYGVSYPILVAMAANDADTELVPQTMQLFALTYFIGIFGFPLIAGWMIVELSVIALLILVAALAAVEATLALIRSRSRSVDQIK